MILEVLQTKHQQVNTGRESPELEGCRREGVTLVGEANPDVLPRQDAHGLPRKKAVLMVWKKGEFTVFTSLKSKK